MKKDLQVQVFKGSYIVEKPTQCVFKLPKSIVIYHSEQFSSSSENWKAFIYLFVFFSKGIAILQQSWRGLVNLISFRSFLRLMNVTDFLILKNLFLSCRDISFWRQNLHNNKSKYILQMSFSILIPVSPHSGFSHYTQNYILMAFWK